MKQLPTRRPTEPIRAVVRGSAPPQTARAIPAVRRPRKHRAILFVLSGPQQGAVFPLARCASIGRGDGVDVGLVDESISRGHARITRDDDTIFIEDLGSRNGTFIAEERISGLHRITDGEHIRFGHSTIVKFAMVDELEERALLSLYESTLRDPLTRLFNRRYFDDRLFSEYSYSHRHSSSLAVLMVDIDHFKRINDMHGHQAGDVVLKMVAATIQRVMRPEDVVARYGGEEFVVIARNTSLRNAQILSERIRHRIEQLELAWSDRPLRVTASVGVAAFGEAGVFESADALVAAADEALYEAKHLGRNRVCFRAGRDGKLSVPVPMTTVELGPPSNRRTA